MKNKYNHQQSASRAPKKENKGKVTKLPRMEMYAVLGLELSKSILEKLQKLEDLVDILARQKARELKPKRTPPKAEATQ